MRDIEQSLNGQLRYDKVPKKEVESWLRKAKTIIEATQRIEDKFSKGNYFLHGWRGKLVDEKIQEVKGVYDQGVFPAGLVIDAPDEIGLPLPTSEMAGEASVKEKIWKHLISGKVRKIGVWGMHGKEEVGIPEPTVMDGCKLVLTTRSMEVAPSKGCEEIKVEPLSEMEAFDLFLNKVRSELLDIPTLQSTLKQTVKQCDGLLLAIVTLASTMKGECDVHIWENALNELKACIASVENMVEKMHDLMRDTALYITRQSPRYLVKAGMQSRELPTDHKWTEDLHKVSLMRNKISKIRLDMTLPKFATLSTLLLQDNKYLEVKVFIKKTRKVWKNKK
ncbi:hypothetical protein Patl1_04581 [Pistacia atlantica]|uniref:Uncharacterized protein n=1 Tax=Pistacia atlantica TaxID=434234 RepID=A0ACC1BUQ9_9ROSI|nr:hypothetical protein Patl1_04581 [Pistacia atlantica]